MATQTLDEVLDAPQGGYKRYRRNIFTGELEEIRDDPAADFKKIRQKFADNYSRFVTKRRLFADPYDTGRLHRCRSISLKAEDATPERIAAENESARKHGTGAMYAPDGTCYVPTRGSRAKEFRRVRAQDNDAGYGDWGGR